MANLNALIAAGQLMAAPLESPDEPAGGSADPVGDDQAQRTSVWGGIDECGADKRPGLLARLRAWFFSL